MVDKPRHEDHFSTFQAHLTCSSFLTTGLDELMASRPREGEVDRLINDLSALETSMADISQGNRTAEVTTPPGDWTGTPFVPPPVARQHAPELDHQGIDEAHSVGPHGGMDHGTSQVDAFGGSAQGTTNDAQEIQQRIDALQSSAQLDVNNGELEAVLGHDAIEKAVGDAVRRYLDAYRHQLPRDPLMQPEFSGHGLSLESPWTGDLPRRFVEGSQSVDRIATRKPRTSRLPVNRKKDRQYSDAHAMHQPGSGSPDQSPVRGPARSQTTYVTADQDGGLRQVPVVHPVGTELRFHGNGSMTVQPSATMVGSPLLVDTPCPTTTNHATVRNTHPTAAPMPTASSTSSTVMPKEMGQTGKSQKDPLLDKIRSSFKYKQFSGTSRDGRHFKTWHRIMLRYLSIQRLDHVLREDFAEVLPLSASDFEDNKLVYYILEDSVSTSSLASKHFRKAPIWDGHAAYHVLCDAFLFAGPTTSTLLLADLSKIRFQEDETPTEFCLRLQELFEDLEQIPGDAAVTFTDTQKIGYLLSALRHEQDLASVYTHIQTEQVRGRITFDQACDDLYQRCEAIRADALMEKTPRSRKTVKGLVAGKSESEETPSMGSSSGADISNYDELQLKALISAANKRLSAVNRDKKPMATPCLADGCAESTIHPLCKMHFHDVTSGRTKELKLRNGYGKASYNTDSKWIDYPEGIPGDPHLGPRRPKNTKISSGN